MLALIAPAISLIAGLLSKHPAAADPSTPLPSWIAALLAFVTSVTSLQPLNSTANDVADVGTVLGAIQTDGAPYLPPEALSVVGAVSGALSKFGATAKDYVGGGVAVLDDNFSFEGTSGAVFALAKDAYANEIPPGVTTLGGALGLT